MGKLYELLSIDPNAQDVATKLMDQTKQTFKNKEGLFNGKVRTLKLFGRNEQNSIEFDALEGKDKIDIKVEATVPDSLNYMAVFLADHYNIVSQKEASNQTAKADIIIDGVTILKDVPGTCLLGLETKLKSIRMVIEEIPTRTPGIEWVEDKDTGRFLYKAKDIVQDVKTAKTTDHKMLPQPNANIPVTYVPIELQKNIGEYQEMKFTGLISSGEKAALITRLDTLMQAVKQARQRANDVPVAELKMGDPIMKFLFGNWFNREMANPPSISSLKS
jgi:hypothetical protein